MKILVTGANGFIGKNLILELKNRGYTDIYECTRETTLKELAEYCHDVDFVFHLAGINRPNDNSEFRIGNVLFTEKLIEKLIEKNNFCPIVFSSSIQAELENLYGDSKKEAEKLLISYNKETGADVFIFRLPNVFGKWCKPNYNSVVATFCHNIANDLPISINDPNREINLVYIDDVISKFINCIENKIEENLFYYIEISYKCTVSRLASTLKAFKECRDNKFIPNMQDEFIKKLYSTYLSYLPKDEFKYSLDMNIDSRGSFTEFIKTIGFGQVSVNISKAYITKGNHWHHTKNEKFLVVSGKGVIRFRNVFSDEVIEYFVTGDKLEVVDIPTGYTHNIENLGDCDMVTIMWANEIFDAEKPDTFFEEV